MARWDLLNSCPAGVDVSRSEQPLLPQVSRTVDSPCCHCLPVLVLVDSLCCPCDDISFCEQPLLSLPMVWLLLEQAHTLASVSTVRHGPDRIGVTWKTPSSTAFVPLQEPVAVLALLHSLHANAGMKQYECVPRRLFFATQQRIAITWKPK